MQGIILSVIVPVYNAVQFIARCIDSLLVQWPEDDRRYEIICINDGSTDGTFKLLEEYQSKYPWRIKLLDQENHGHSIARNKGLFMAQGEVIAFCDADDYVVTGAYYYLYTHFWDEKIDVLKFNSITLDKYMLKKWSIPPLTGNISYEGLGHDALIKGQLPSFIWSIFYKREFLENHQIQLHPYLIGEDEHFNLDVYINNPRVRIVDTYAYCYTTSKTQLTRVRAKDSMRKMVDGYLVLFDKHHLYCDQYPIVKDGLKKAMCGQLLPFVSRTLCAKLSILEFNRIKQNLLKNELLPAQGVGPMGLIINLTLKNFFVFRISGFFYKNIFVRFILPHLSRN